MFRPIQLFKEPTLVSSLTIDDIQGLPFLTTRLYNELKSLRGGKSPNHYIPIQAVRCEASVAVLILSEASDEYGAFGLHVTYTTTTTSNTMIGRSLRI